MDLNIVTLNSDPFHILNKTHPWGTISIHKCPLISLLKHLHCAGHWRLSPNPEGPLRRVIWFYEIKRQLIWTFFPESILSQPSASNLGGSWVTHEADPWKDPWTSALSLRVSELRSTRFYHFCRSQGKGISWEASSKETPLTGSTGHRDIPGRCKEKCLSTFAYRWRH